MSCLHLLSKSPASGLLRQAARTFATGDGLLLLGDGVYCLREPRGLAALPDDIKLYALAPDLRARGLALQDCKESLAGGATILDYDGFVALCAEYDKTLSWF